MRDFRSILLPFCRKSRKSMGMDLKPWRNECKVRLAFKAHSYVTWQHIPRFEGTGLYKDAGCWKPNVNDLIPPDLLVSFAWVGCVFFLQSFQNARLTSNSGPLRKTSWCESVFSKMWENPERCRRRFWWWGAGRGSSSPHFRHSWTQHQGSLGNSYALQFSSTLQSKMLIC